MLTGKRGESTILLGEALDREKGRTNDIQEIY
jgi:hypothetical protein